MKSTHKSKFEFRLAKRKLAEVARWNPWAIDRLAWRMAVYGRPESMDALDDAVDARTWTRPTAIVALDVARCAMKMGNLDGWLAFARRIDESTWTKDKPAKAIAVRVAKFVARACKTKKQAKNASKMFQRMSLSKTETFRVVVAHTHAARLMDELVGEARMPAFGEAISDEMIVRQMNGRSCCPCQLDMFELIARRSGMTESSFESEESILRKMTKKTAAVFFALPRAVRASVLSTFDFALNRSERRTLATAERARELAVVSDYSDSMDE